MSKLPRSSSLELAAYNGDKEKTMFESASATPLFAKQPLPAAAAMPVTDEQPDLERLNGIVERVVHQNEEDGYLVASVKQERGPTITVIGRFPVLFAGEAIDARGKWIFNPTYGRQFRAETI